MLVLAARHDSVPSTQEICRDLARRGAPEGTAVLAREQTAGRGRASRAWVSPSGGLWMSFVLRPSRPLAEWSRITPVVAVAAARAVESLARESSARESSVRESLARESSLPPHPAAQPVAIKWPNDLYVADRKLGGILAETDGPAVIVGVGINVRNELPVGLAATSLSDLRVETEPAVLAERLGDELAPLYDAFQAGAFIVREELRARFYLRGRDVTLGRGSDAVRGRAVDVGPEGELLVETAGGLVACFGGELALS